MSNRYAQIVVLAEDERSANFLRRYLLRALPVDNRNIRQVISPSGKGDAKKWLLSQYPKEVKALRSRYPKTGLVVHIDADSDSVVQREGQLAETLRSKGIAAREPDERIIHAIPQRNIETWLCHLTGINVTEAQDCKRDRLLPDFDAVVSDAALRLYDLTRANGPISGLPSLAIAVTELRRLEP